ncbi:hypothetical protein Tco_0478788 [Tanacetum coccineum]
MADLKFVDQHNMVACLEKTEENAEFHQIVDFLSTCSINYALTVSPTIYASYIEQFWNTATSKTVNSVKQIHAIVDGKAVVISESSVRSDLLFNDEDGIACLTNDEIFENLALMGYEQLSTKLTFQKGKVTSLFDSMLVQNQAPEGKGSAIPAESQPTLFTLQPNVSEPQTKSLQTETPLTTRSERVLKKPNEPLLPKGHTSGSREGSKEHTFELMDTVPRIPHDSPLLGGYTPGSDEGRLKLKELMAICTKLSKQVLDLEKKDAQAVKILKLKQRVKKLERKRKSNISHPRRRIYRQVESSDDDLDEEDASKQGRESDKTKSMFQDSDFDVLDDDMEDIEGEIVHTITTRVSAVSAPVTTAGVAINFDNDKGRKAKEKGVSIKDVEDSPRPIRLITIRQPLPTIDSKDKGKGVLVEEEPEKPAKVKRRDQGLAKIESDAELAQRLHGEELAEIDVDHELAKKETIGIRKSRGNKEQTTYKNSSQEQDDYLPQIYGQQQAESTKKRPRADFEEESSKKQKLEEDNDAKKRSLEIRLFDSYGVHVLLMNIGVAIHVMIEKKYPLTQEMLSRMLNRRLEVDYESEMAFELLRFTYSQLQK